MTQPSEWRDVSLGRPTVADDHLLLDGVKLVFDPSPRPERGWMEHLERLLRDTGQFGGGRGISVSVIAGQLELGRVPLSRLDEILDVVERCAAETNRWVRDDVLPAMREQQAAQEAADRARADRVEQAKRLIDEHYQSPE